MENFAGDPGLGRLDVKTIATMGRALSTQFKTPSEQLEFARLLPHVQVIG